MEAFDIHHPIHRISVEQFHRMSASGVFADGDRVELIDGEMRDLSPIGPPHGSSVDTLNMLLAPRLVGAAIVRVQGPLVLDAATEVYPDLMVLRQRDDRYAESNPTGEDARLVIEVADTSLAVDRGIKLAKYAGAGIRRYWVVDLPQRTLHDYRDPNAFGRRYRQLHSLREGTLALTIEAVEIRVEVADLFPR